MDAIVFYGHHRRRGLAVRRKRLRNARCRTDCVARNSYKLEQWVVHCPWPDHANPERRVT